MEEHGDLRAVRCFGGAEQRKRRLILPSDSFWFDFSQTRLLVSVVSVCRYSGYHAADYSDDHGNDNDHKASG